MNASADIPASAAQSAWRRRLGPSRIGGWLVWGMVAIFFIALFALIFTVFLDSIATTWFGSWLPDDFTTHWYGDAWAEFDLANVRLVTGQLAGCAVVSSALQGVTDAP